MRFSWTAPHPPTPPPRRAAELRRPAVTGVYRESPVPSPCPFWLGSLLRSGGGGGVVGSLQSPTPRVVAEISRWDVCSFPQEEG